MYIRPHVKNIFGLNAKKCVWSAIFGAFFFFLMISFPHGGLYVVTDTYPRDYLKEVEECVPKTHIMYLKTHKCASSTIQNIFLRYGYKNNLTFALGSSGNYLGNPAKFKPSMLDKSSVPSSGLIDIFCMHSRFDLMEMGKVLHPDTIFISSIRNPISQFESLYRYFALESLYKTTLENFANHTLMNLKNIKRNGRRFGKNQMLFDFGSEEDISVEDLRKKIEEIDKIFVLIMIAEKMEESLILLRHKLCWSLDDVAVFTKNARRDEVKMELSEEAVQRIKELNSADFILYDHFLLKHKEMVHEFGEDRMRREVLELKQIIKDNFSNCVKLEVSGRDDRLSYKEYSALVKSYVLNNDTEEFCRTLVMPELPFINIIRDRQKSMFSPS